MVTSQFTQYSTLTGIIKTGWAPSWIPSDELERIQAYEKYDQMYWNDQRQFSLRVLEGEEPIYIPNARTVVDTTSHYLLKGLAVGAEDNTTKAALKAFLDRELFYSRFQTAKHAGVARGDFVFHLTADPRKEEGTRLSLNSVDPSMVFPIYDEDIPDELVGCHIVDVYKVEDRDDKDFGRERVRKLTYRIVRENARKRISREEAIFEMTPKWWGPEPKKIRQTIPLGFLDERITSTPIYWFRNQDWEGQLYGSSELRGIEGLIRAVSQGSTDTQGSLSLEGLGVYATDGGRPVDNSGTETDWEISPGRVMEVPSGAYFRRVEGVGSITPMTDQFNYLESKIREATALSDVALGRVDVQTAQSGIALAIKFMPTLAKIDERDKAGLGKLKQLFFDWKTWHSIFENQDLQGDVTVEIGEKLPQDRVALVNELNNMLDRKIISRKYYRTSMEKLGYEFPEDLEAEIEEELKKDAERAAALAPPALQPNAVAAAVGDKPPPANGGVAQGSQTPRGQDAQGNRSNNRNRPNESGGTESGQTLRRQARGVRS